MLNRAHYVAIAVVRLEQISTNRLNDIPMQNAPFKAKFA